MDLVDLPQYRRFTGIERDGGGLRVGAATTLAELAADPLAAPYRALVQAARQIATPQVRAMATVAGNLLQRTRCPYFRNLGFACLKKGDADCAARTGTEQPRGTGLIADGCVWPHPSTLATVLMAYDARVERHAEPALSVGELIGDGADRDHTLPTGSLVTAVLLPDADAHSSYVRASARRRADWPLAEVAICLRMTDSVVRQASAVAGALATAPVRLHTVEEALSGRRMTSAGIRAAADTVGTLTGGSHEAAYKLTLVRGLVHDALTQLLSAD